MAEPLLLEPDEGELISAARERLVRIKCSREELALTEFRYGAGERGPERHIHREHSDGFWVLAGELTVEVGREHDALVLGEGSFALAPPGLVHTFWNDGPDDAVFLNLHAPSKGFGEYLMATRDARTDEERRAAAELFEQWDPPEDGGPPASVAHVLRKGEGETIALGRNRLTIKAGREQAGGDVLVMESQLEADFPGPVAHRHAGLTDMYYVLDGVLGLILEDRTVQLPQSGFALIPPGTAHTFFNPHGHPLRVLNLMTPAGFEQYYRDLFAELPADAPPDPEQMAAIASRYDFEPVG
jgi:mannose-6-phosphate isomerase-like protein (cupin superfamily)